MVSGSSKDGTPRGGQGRGAGRNRRRHERGFSSYALRYGAKGPIHRAYARRLSQGGLFIATNLHVFAEGVVLDLAVEIRGVVYPVRGVVRHALKVEARYVGISKPGMGIEFLDASEDLKKAIAEGR
jgi:hypothetical protein